MKAAALFGVLGFVLAGCAAPDRGPEGALLDGPALGLTGPAAPAASEWWRAWGDPQFDSLVERALAGNPRLAEAMARVEAARSAASMAKADSLPRVTLDGEGQYQRFSNRFIYPPPLGGGHYFMGSVQGNLSWDLDFWGRQKALIEQGRLGLDAAALDAQAARLALTATLAEAYVGLRHAYTMIEIADRTVAQRERLFTLAGKRVRAGLDSRIEEKQAEGLLAQARVVRQQALNDRDMAVHAIAALTGQGANAYEGIARPALETASMLPLPEALPADLLGRRPDVLAARLRVDAATAGQAAARAAFYPNVNLAAFAGWQAIGLGHLLDPSARAYGAGPAVHLPLFDARLKPNYAAATAEIDIAIASYNGAVVAAVQQVADRLSGISSLRLEIADQAKARLAAEQAFALAERRYGGGLSTYLAVLSAETQLLDARRQEASLDAQYAIERIKLLVAMGGDFAAGPGSEKTTSAALDRPAAKE